MDTRSFNILKNSLRQLREVGTHGALSMSTMRSAGNEALIELIEARMMQMLAEDADRTPLVSALDRASKRLLEQEGTT